MSKRKIIGWSVAGLFLGIQFIQPHRNNDGKAPGLAFVHQYSVPDSVNRILQAACYDCHSNRTRYPWYSFIQPAGWILARHIRRGKAKLNFSEFDSYSLRRQISKLKSIASQIEDNDMPLSSYKWLHKEARLSAEQKKLIIAWMRAKADSLSTVTE